MPDETDTHHEVGTAKDNGNSTAQNKGGNLYRFWKVLLDNKAAAWTAAFTGILTAITFNLMCLNQRANKTTIASQRAFINSDPSLVGNKILDQGSGKIAGIRFLM